MYLRGVYEMSMFPGKIAIPGNAHLNINYRCQRHIASAHHFYFDFAHNM